MPTDLEIMFATPGGPYNMGLGPIGTGGLIFKRKFRWTMSIEYCIDNEPKFVPEEFVKVGARPQIDIEETEINFLHGKMWIPGKATWQTMTVTYYDLAGTAPELNFGAQINSLFGWLASVYDITDPTKLYMGSRLSDYEGQGLIFLYDGCGNVVEGWLLNNVWPQSINFGELDMASSDECTIELTLRYSNVKYVSYCPGGSIDKCPCTPCEISSSSSSSSSSLAPNSCTVPCAGCTLPTTLHATCTASDPSCSCLTNFTWTLTKQGPDLCVWDGTGSPGCNGPVTLTMSCDGESHTINLDVFCETGGGDSNGQMTSVTCSPFSATYHGSFSTGNCGVSSDCNFTIVITA